MSNIWAFKYVLDKDSKTKKVTTKSSIPILVPAASDNNVRQPAGANGKITTIDVVKDYMWTNSPQSSREEVPSIILTEKRLKTNALISQLLYSFGNAIEGVQDIQQYIGKVLGEDNAFQKALDFLQKTAGNAANAATNAVDKSAQSNTAVGRVLSDAVSLKDENSVMDSTLLQAYKNLYMTQDTGWRYILPYFNNYNNDAANTFGSDTTNLPTLGVMRAAAEGIASFNEAVAALQTPATFSFAERAKFYSYPEQGDEITIEFPLINTGAATYDDVKKHWQFLFLILYQNKPGRVTNNVIEPPVIYQAEIPGQKFLPFSYISSLAVDFKGSRRTLEMAIPVQEQYFAESPYVKPSGRMSNNQVISPSNFDTEKTITTIIPDAYMIKITLKGLVADSRNFMAAALESNGVGDFSANIRDRETILNEQRVVADSQINRESPISLRPPE